MGKMRSCQWAGRSLLLYLFLLCFVVCASVEGKKRDALKPSVLAPAKDAVPVPRKLQRLLASAAEKPVDGEGEGEAEGASTKPNGSAQTQRVHGVGHETKDAKTQRHARGEPRSLNSTTAYEDEEEQSRLETLIFLTGVAVCGLVLLALCVEVFMQWLEKALARKHMSELLQQLCKEMMIVGLCMILLYVEERAKFYQNVFGEPVDDVFFETVHFALLFSMLIYLVSICALMYFTTSLSFFWAIVEGPTADENSFAVHATQIDNAWQSAAAEYKDMSSFRFLLDLPFRMRYYMSRDQYQYHLCRRVFIEEHNLRSDFEFHLYLRHCVRRTCTDMTGVHWSVWALVFVAVFLNTLRTRYIDVDVWHGAAVYFAVAYSLLVFTCVVAWKSRKIFEELLSAVENGESTYKPQGHHSLPTDGLNDNFSDATDVDSDNEHEARAFFASGDTAHHRLFWFGNPHFLACAVQLIVLSESIMLALYLGNLNAQTGYYHFFSEFSYYEMLLLHFAALLPYVLCIFFILPWTMPSFVFSRSTGVLWCPEGLALAQSAARKRKRRAASSSGVGVVSADTHV